MLNLPILIGSRWKLGRKIGSGSFGEIFLVTEVLTGKEHAMKLEPQNRRNPHLAFECRQYRILDGIVGIPKVYWFGVAGDYFAMVIDLLGPSLEDMFVFCGKKLKLKTTLMLIDQIIMRIEQVHNRGIIHRDIKPHNFLLGRGRTDRLIFLIDFGLAKRFRDPKTLEHVPYREGTNFTGTARYVSVNSHLGITQSRRDDIESLGYVFLYFLKGNLPWQGLKANSKRDKYDKIMDKKLNETVGSLTKGCPPAFREYLLYARGLPFAAKPNYLLCRKLFKDLFVSQGFEYDYIYDWCQLTTSATENQPANNILKNENNDVDEFIKQTKPQTVIPRSVARGDRAKFREVAI